VFAVVGFFGALLGQVTLAFFIKKYKKQAIVIFLLTGTPHAELALIDAGVMVGSLLAMAASGIYATIDCIRHTPDVAKCFSFRPLCT
jgi:hypothetical protein